MSRTKSGLMLKIRHKKNENRPWENLWFIFDRLDA
jgi:hypothetical protein